MSIINNSNNAESFVGAVSRLLEDRETPSDFDPDMPPMENSADAFSPSVFWGVNGFLLFMVICMCLWCAFAKKDFLTAAHHRRRETDEAYQQSLRDRIQQQQAAKIVPPEKRKKRLLQSFKRHNVQMTVKDEDLLLDATTSTDFNTNNKNDKAADDIESGGNANLDDSFTSHNTGYLQLPLCAQHHKKPVSNCCAVCLGAYSVGDKVVWSSNSECPHVFHEECILEWLIKMQPATPCPCCRQEFTDLEEVRKEKKITWSGNAFNITSIGF